MIIIIAEKETDIELILDRLESKIRKHVKQTIIDEREDLSQELKLKMLEKIDALLDAEVPGFIEFAKDHLSD